LSKDITNLSYGRVGNVPEESWRNKYGIITQRRQDYMYATKGKRNKRSLTSNLLNHPTFLMVSITFPTIGMA
jgi:hypothetical protein